MNERAKIDSLLAENDRLRREVRAFEQALRETTRAADDLRALVYLDSLTGLPNRRWLDDNFDRILSARRAHHRLAVLFVDLDDFKQINDSVGHRAADALLREFSNTLRRLIRDGDTLRLNRRTAGTRTGACSPILSRLGGDEFVVLLPQVRHREAAEVVAQRILRFLSRPLRVEDRNVLITVSIGIAIYPSDGETTEVLIHNADAAMYRAKQSGKARYECHAPSRCPQ